MVVDTSALLAIALLEAEAQPFMDMLNKADRRLISAVSVVEAGIVAEARAGALGGDRLDKIIVELGLELNRSRRTKRGSRGSRIAPSERATTPQR